MDDCMPHYYKITGNHVQGAEKIMRAEAAYMQGNFTDAYITLESAYGQIDGKVSKIWHSAAIFCCGASLSMPEYKNGIPLKNNMPRCCNF